MGSIPNIIKQLWLHHYIEDTLEALIITLTLFTTMLMLDVGPPSSVLMSVRIFCLVPYWYLPLSLES